MVSIRLIIITTLLSTTLSCGGGPSGANWPIGPTSQAYLPFIEAVELPQTVSAGEEFEIRLTVSCDSNPSVLYGLPIDLPVQTGEVYVGSTFIASAIAGPDTHKLLRVRPWISAPIRKGEAINWLTIRTSLHDPGEYYILIYSADQKAFGGIQATYLFPGGIPQTPHESYQEYTITVLPAE